MKDQDLIQSLTGAGFLAKEAGDKLLKDAQTEKKSVEAIIYDRRLVDETDLAKVKSKFLGIPYKKIDSEIIAKDILEIIPRKPQTVIK